VQTYSHFTCANCTWCRPIRYGTSMLFCSNDFWKLYRGSKKWKHFDVTRSYAVIRSKTNVHDGIGSVQRLQSAACVQDFDARTHWHSTWLVLFRLGHVDGGWPGRHIHSVLAGRHIPAGFRCFWRRKCRPVNCSYDKGSADRCSVHLYLSSRCVSPVTNIYNTS